ncbi:hypothetical protein KAW64_08645, partial [bacterium]|nr:hypothetical protein [bacterium]
GGCSDSSAGPESPPGPEFRDRTTPVNVIYNLELAYEEMNAEEYLDCLSEDFIFFPSPADLQDPTNDMPDEWYKSDETSMHDKMFTGDDAVESITLTLTHTTIEHDPGDPGDPLDDIYVYVEAVDLMVNLYTGQSYLATAPSEYWFRVDTDQSGEDGEIWWEIYMWFDLDPAPPGARGGGDGRTESTSWGSIKAMYQSP